MENTARNTSYDELAYPSAVYSQTHPGSIGVVARLSGLTPTSVERCRVLELGCGDGLNLISMAYALPGSEFIGVDLATQPIARGTALAEGLALRNITLKAMDVAEIDENFGQFDYIIAHGLYSWVPEPVRNRILEICRFLLTPHGVVYISYNAYPGNHLRDLVRGMMHYHAAHFSRPAEKIAQSRGLIRLLSQAGEKSDPYLQILARESERIQKYTDAGFFHDDLSAVNQPFYFHAFVAEAGRHGLQFLGEAGITDKLALTYPPHIQTVLNELDPADVIGGEQYRDFLRCRAFRQTLLCHKEVPVDHRLDAQHMRGLFLSGKILPASGIWDVHSEEHEVFLGARKSEFETGQPLLKSAFARLTAAEPQFLSFEDLWEQVRDDLGTHEDTAKNDLASALLQMSIAGGLQVLTYRPSFLLTVSEKPMVSALARLEIGFSHQVSNLLNDVVEVKDFLSRLLLSLLDGTRDRSTLLALLQKSVRDGSLAQSPAPDITEANLEAELEKLARLALLVG